MTRAIVVAAMAAVALVAAEKPIKLEKMPAAVQRAVEAEKAKGAEIKGLQTEIENGKTVYEIETVVSGRTRDLLVDKSGTIVEVEEEATLDSIPAPAKEAIEKKAAGGKINKVEKVTKGETSTYEAAITSRSGKRSEVAVKADGSPTK